MFRSLVAMLLGAALLLVILVTFTQKARKHVPTGRSNKHDTPAPNHKVW